MTVCVAVICENNTTIIGASDRMLTAGNVQFQPPASKTYQLTSSIVVMVAGDMLIQAEIITSLQTKINYLLNQEPTPDWLNVKDVAAMYSEQFNAIKARRGENEFLIPLGLTLESFISRQNELAPHLVTNLVTELIGKTMPGIGAVIAGIDRTGPHIYVVENGVPNCHDAAGFAAIGSGWYHASSHLMFSQHGKNGTLARSLLLTYTAKKRAEVAPGVGIETDMFIIQNLGGYFMPAEHVVAEFQKTYAASVTAHAKVEKSTERKAHDYIDRLINDIPKSQQEKQQTDLPAPSVEGGNSDASVEKTSDD